HTWPGATPVPTLGNTNLDFNASGEIWKFFRKHILTPTLNPVSVLENTATESLDIWPNPSSDFVIISGEEIQQADISITSILGQSFTLPNATQQEKGRLELDISQLKSGIYLIKVTNSEKVLSRILVKQ
ncbi:MAG: T9SS type A sorting domain-containing protein, partial [Flavobacteriales bacterium]|nr:T9SS type A sorting domain-containing protein [Flavobacteriales bacterium]